jgi:hypothetical protein
MSDLIMLPDAERVLVDFLRAQPELIELIDARIFTALPGEPTWPSVRVVRWGGWAAIYDPLVLDEAWCQVDTWADRKALASDVARLMRAVISARVKRECDVVSGFRFGMMIDSPDTTFVPAKPHIRFDMSLMLRPSAAPTGAHLEAAAPPRSTDELTASVRQGGTR